MLLVEENVSVLQLKMDPHQCKVLTRLLEELRKTTHEHTERE